MTASWVGTAAAYDRSFAKLCAGAAELLLDALGAPDAPGVQGGSGRGDASAAGGAGAAGRLLDAGSGTGVLARVALDRGWRVDAVDLDPGMSAHLAAHLPAAASRTASMAALPYADHAFDAIGACFSLNHADHPQQTTAELRRVARPGAPIAATVWPWQRTEMNALWGDIMDATDTRPSRFALPAGEPFERTEEGLSGLLAGAGFGALRTERLVWTFEIEPAELWLGVQAGIATIGQAYAGADDAGRARIGVEYERRTAELAVDGMLRFPVEAILAAGRA